jgi:hypothetical protein
MDEDELGQDHSMKTSFHRWHRRGAADHCPSAGLALAALLALAAAPAQASMFKGEALDKAADILTWVVLVAAPLIGLTVFWLVHILPEKIAHKRHHPQKDAIQTLCLLSLVFGGMLWPLAWLWAYARPAAYRLAYGTEKHDEYFVEMGDRAQAGELSSHELAALKSELAAIDQRGGLSAELRLVREKVEAATPASAPSEAPATATPGSA